MPELGLIEGFYGQPWSWMERAANVEFLAPYGYRFYLYAPKADPYLRKRWQEDHPAPWAAQLAQLAAHCRQQGVRFGVGLSPFESYLDFGAEAQAALGGKLAFFDAIGVEDLAILFDDMRGDVPALAERQMAIMEWVAGRTTASRLLFCPTYYSDDPVLDTVFGQRPSDYLSCLGQGLDKAVQVFWTGEEVCSRAQSPAHLVRVAENLQRKPFLWDNYPVNDGQRMSQYLHLRGFVGRSADLAPYVAAHGINPAVQPVLSRIPALTLVDCYQQGAAYQYSASFASAAIAVLGETLGRQLREDLLALQDIGLDRLGDRAAYLRGRYASSSHPGAQEIMAWLDGKYRMTDALVQTQ